MRVPKKLWLNLQEDVADLHTQLDILDDTLGISGLDDYPDEGLAGVSKNMRKILLDMNWVLDD